MSSAIAIVGMACCYPDARNPDELWENVLAQRRAFRRIPPERLRLEDYFSGDVSVRDAVYANEAALIEGYEFDRVRFRVAGPTFRTADLAHWLALDVADQALQDAGFRGGQGLPLETTGVLVGNTLTGEFSRAATLRLRWPYIRRVVEPRLSAEGWDRSRRSEFLDRLEEEYKAPFPPVGEETLAGSLSNTIAGRICNYFNFRGGGYTVDGACSSSLLGVANACSALESGELDAAVAGGVDLSIDPFELVGFSKAGALAHGEMLVYDRHSSGFLPGEGCGFVLLMRAADAIAQRLRIYATIRGWGISSDGGGGITRPEVRGQTLALERAYKRANYEINSVALFEGHGTGTAIGDEVELKALSYLRKAAGKETQAAAIGSIKANLGHTKAAAGIAGLIKATLAVYHLVLPPTTGVRHPRPEVEGSGAALRVLAEAEPWPADMPIRAGVNSFGFGGINVHVTIENSESKSNRGSLPREKAMAGSIQDVEVFFLEGGSTAELIETVKRLENIAANLSYSELSDLSVQLAEGIRHKDVRASIVAASPKEFAERLRQLRVLLQNGEHHYLDLDEGVFLGTGSKPPRIGLLFPGQASPVRLHPGLHGRRFDEIKSLYGSAALPDSDSNSTEVAQLAIITAELAGLKLLEKLGIEAVVAVGHSVGELAAYTWAGVLDDTSLLDLVRLRGRVMAQVNDPCGSMASIGASASEVDLLREDGEKVVIACMNAAHQTVISGESEAVARFISRARRQGWTASLLSTAGAFHSPLMAPAAKAFRKLLIPFDLRPRRKTVISSITGLALVEDAQLSDLLVEQLTRPVQFMQAISQAEHGVDLFIEVGPASILTHLLRGASPVPAISLDMAATSLVGLFKALGAAFVLNAPVKLDPLFKDRFARPFDINRRPTFFANPCEQAPIPDLESGDPATPFKVATPAPRSDTPAPSSAAPSNAVGAVNLIRNIVARRAELPPDSVSESAQFLRDLHLNSIVVGEIAANAARELGVAPPENPLSFADGTIRELAQTLEQSRNLKTSLATQNATPTGIDDWCRAFSVDWTARPLSHAPDFKAAPGEWRFFGSPDDPRFRQLSRTALPGNGALVCLPAAPVDDQVDMLFAAARSVIAMTCIEKYFAVLGPVALAGAFAMTVNAENPDILTRVVEASPGCDVVHCILSELSGPRGHSEARYDPSGLRYEPGFSLLAVSEKGTIPLSEGEVVLVSGGAKGIAAECAFALAKKTKATLVLLGRSHKDDAAVSAQLRKLQARGVTASYIQTDVTNLRAVQAAVDAAERMYGPICGLIHGAGNNEPRLLAELDGARVRDAVAPKVHGFLNLTATIDSSHLRLLVAFGSVIGRIGLRGEAHYAVANAYLSALTEDFARLHPTCRCLAFESSAWSGVGMAERLGKLDTLRSAGIAPISVDEGVSQFLNLVGRSLPATSIVVSGRLGANPPAQIGAPALPLLRFLERPRVFYPGVELIVEADLSTASDPYLLDHIFDGQPLLPAVVGMEAMAQAAMAVLGETEVPQLENLRFDHPIIVPSDSCVTVRIAALARESGKVDVVIRSSQTSFQVSHFRCSCHFGQTHIASDVVLPIPDNLRLPVDPQRDLYGSLLFQGARFQRLTGYLRLSARSSWAEISAAPSEAWFNSYLPGKLVLGDAAARDAALHSIQSCVPDSVLLPLSVDRIWSSQILSSEELIAHASERWQDGDTYCYDLELRSAAGAVREYWQGLCLRRVEDAKEQSWPDPLAAAFLEWQLRRAAPGARVYAAFERDASVDRRRRTERAIQRALDTSCEVRWRADGKPEIAAPLTVSATHSVGLTLAVAAAELTACDMEPVRERRDDLWRDLLGPERWLLAQLIADVARESLNTAATRVWTAMESLAKAELFNSGPLVWEQSHGGRSTGVSLAAPGVIISTSVIRLRSDPTPFVIAILTRSELCAATSTSTEFALKKPMS